MQQGSYEWPGWVSTAALVRPVVQVWCSDERVREWLWGSPAFFSMTKVTLFFIKNSDLYPKAP